MRYINNLNKRTVKELEEVVKDDTSLQTRQRAQSILLSNDGISVKELCKIFNKSSRTIYRWFAVASIIEKLSRTKLNITKNLFSMLLLPLFV